jgi:hypothetical protein
MNKQPSLACDQAEARLTRLVGREIPEDEMSGTLPTSAVETKC